VVKSGFYLNSAGSSYVLVCITPERPSSASPDLGLCWIARRLFFRHRLTRGKPFSWIAIDQMLPTTIIANSINSPPPISFHSPPASLCSRAHPWSLSPGGIRLASVVHSSICRFYPSILSPSSHLFVSPSLFLVSPVFFQAWLLNCSS
jgi:hypothetical protein